VSESVTIHEAKTHFSRLIARVRRGASITIAKAGTPVARLVPVGRVRAPKVSEPSVLPDTGPGSDRAARIQRFLEQEVWPLVPEAERGRRLSREEEDAILGYGSEGV
jgi:prevent-host-death family protein